MGWEAKQIDLSISSSTALELQFLTIQGYPFEVCGLIHEHDAIRQYSNTFCGNRAHGFDMEVDIEDETIKAIWHSHPTGPIEPSSDDLPAMKLLYEHGFPFPWIIVTPKYVSEWMCVQV